MGARVRALDRYGKPYRSFDPHRVARLESVAWVSYYRRDWPRFLYASLMLTRHTFRLRWPAAIRASWLVMRAIQCWAPQEDNDPDGARRTMRRFYELVKREHGETYDPEVAAELEIEWWRIHREHQWYGCAEDEQALITAMSKLYSYAYSVPESGVRPAAEQRALAMRLSDRWVAEGRDPASPLIGDERAALVRSYAALLAAVQVP
jgi:hypothetical protein